MDKPTDTARLNNLLYLPVSFCLSVCLSLSISLSVVIDIVDTGFSLLVLEFLWIWISSQLDLSNAGLGRMPDAGSRKARPVDAEKERMAGERLSWAELSWAALCRGELGRTVCGSLLATRPTWRPAKRTRCLSAVRFGPRATPGRRSENTAAQKRRQIFFFKSRGDYFYLSYLF